MVDDQNQRPYRGNETPARAAAPGGSDPLAELARLIGQNDPFSEFGGNRRPAAARQPEPAPAWPPEPARLAPSAPPAPQSAAPQYGSQDFTRQSFGSVPLAGSADLYHAGTESQGYQAATPPGAAYEVPNYEVPGYGAPGYEAHGFPAETAASGYEQDPFPKSQSPFAPQPGSDDDYYDDAPPNRRRIGIMAIAGVFALAVIGTAGAFGYRAIFGSSSVSSPPPVIKAEQAPSKIVPAAATKDAPANKVITERVNERGQGEKLLSREEQPVPVVTTNSAPQPSSGVVGAEPKKIRTIAIKPDQAGDGAPQMTEPAPVPAPTSQPRVIATTPQRPASAPVPVPAPAPVQLASPQPQAEPEPARAPAARAAQPAARTAASANAPNSNAPSANAPLSLNPNAAPAPARPAAPQRAAAAAAPAAVSGGGYAVQVSAQRSEEEAQAAFRSLQGKYPGQLGNRQPFIKRVDLGEKGIFFRALVGPFGDSAQASQMCASLKSAGGSCLVQKN
jgi:hypothetical protein